MRVGELAKRHPVAVDRILLALALVVPCRYLWPLDAGYYFDWANHQWAIGYFGEYFRHHGTMPAAFQTPQLAGIAAPVFYGNLFYPLLGVASSVTSPGIAIRIAALAMFWAQYRLVAGALIRIEAPPYLARLVACLVIWAIYPLTNLYNRAALTEFFATGLLTCALALLVLLLHAVDSRERRRYASGLVLCLTLAAGTHPITAMLGIPMFVVVAAVCWHLLRDDRPRRTASLRAVLPWTALAIVCLAPWIYALVTLSSHLTIRHAVTDVAFFPELDAFTTRFAPIPLDPRVGDIAQVSTPYLDAQASLPLLVVLGAVASVALLGTRPRRKVGIAVVTSLALFAFFTWISLSPVSYRMLPGVVQMIQFAYRAVTYQNLALLLGVLLVAMARPGELLRRRAITAVALAAFALAAVGMIIKWSHIRAVQTPDASPHAVLDAHDRAALIDLPAQYPWRDYGTADLFTPANPDELAHLVPQTLGADSGDRFGLASPARLTLPATSWIGTNIAAFPWNVVALDGEAIARDELRAYDGKLAVRVPAGNHKLAVRFVPPLAWRSLRALSLLGLLGWCLAMIGLAVVDRRARA